MSRALIAVLLVGFAARAAAAHPPTSLVSDSRGNLFYSDLRDVWMVSPDGHVSLAVGHVHTHELFVDGSDQLFGEDVTNVGDLFRHRIWVRSPDGMTSNVLEWRQGHPSDFEDYSFTRSRDGTQYVVSQVRRSLEVRTSEGVQTTLKLPAEGDLHWPTISASGTVYLGIGSSVWSWDPSRSSGLQIFAEDLIGSSVVFAFVQDRHALMGMWTGPGENLFVADFKGRRVLKISGDGTSSDVYRAGGFWSPVGGLLQADELLVLEASVTNQVRVVRVRSDGTKVVYRAP